MKKEFIDFLNALMEAAPEVVNEKMTDTIKTYIEMIMNDTKSDKPEITDNGKVILNYMQQSDVSMMKARDIADGLGISSRGVSGSLRKLVSDGFFEKVGSNPSVYALTEKGKNYKID